MACAHPVARIAPAPPAAIIARTGCGTYEIERDGTVHPYRSNPAPAWAPAAVSHPAPNVWVAHPNGQLAVYRAGRLLWRSVLRHGNDAVAVDGNTIAFQVWSTHVRKSLWIGHVGEREHRVAYDEDPVGWTANGLVTQNGSELVVRSTDGGVLRVFEGMHSPFYDPADRTVVGVTRSGAVVRTDGYHFWRLARGFRASSWVQVIADRALKVITGSRSVFLQANGSRLGVTIPSAASVTTLPNAAFAYVVRRDFGPKNPGVNHVYVVRPHARPRLLYRRQIPRFSCGESFSVSYTEGRILYVDDEGPVAVLDPTGRERPVDLTRALLPLQPKRIAMQTLGADWATNWR